MEEIFFMIRKYKKLLFDLDNTLVDDDENRKYAFEKILVQRKEQVTNEKLEKFIQLDNQYWKDRAEGKKQDPYKFKTKEEKTIWVRAQRFREYFNGITLEDAIQINEKYINLLKEKIIPIKNSTEILKYLYDKKYELYIVINAPSKVVMHKFTQINVQNLIKDIFSAEEAGYMKPHREFFDKFFSKTNNYNTEEMLIIGDELEKDILGGIQNKIDTCWFNPKKLNNNKYKTNYEICDLLELKKIL